MEKNPQRHFPVHSMSENSTAVRSRGRGLSLRLSEAVSDEGFKTVAPVASSNPLSTQGRGRALLTPSTRPAPMSHVEVSCGQTERIADSSTVAEEVLHEKDLESSVVTHPAMKKPDTTEFGDLVELMTNFCALKLPTGCVYQYDVHIHQHNGQKRDEDDINDKENKFDGLFKKDLVLRNMIIQHPSKFNDQWYAFDGRSVYFKKELDFERTIFVVDYEYRDKIHKYSCDMLRVGRVSFDEIHAIYKERRLNTNFQSALQAANVIMRIEPMLQYYPYERAAFDPKCAPIIDLQDGSESMSGFNASIKLGAESPIVNITVSTAAFFKSGPLMNFVFEFFGVENRDVNFSLTEGMKERLSDVLNSLKVTHTHRNSHEKHRIRGLSRHPANRETFSFQGRRITVADYFQEKYGITLKYPNLPCIHHRKANVPMELASLCFGQPCHTKLNPRQTAKLIETNKIFSPRGRLEAVKNSANLLGSASERLLHEFDAPFETSPITVEAHVMHPPRLLFGKGATVPVDGAWKQQKLLHAVDILVWAIISTSTIKDSFIKDLRKNANEMGMFMFPPMYIRQFPKGYQERRMLEEVKNACRAVQMTFVILDENMSYAKIKREAETSDLNMRTQCLRETTVGIKWNAQIAKSVTMKVNSKMEGTSTSFDPKLQPELLNQPFMAVGADLQHLGSSDTPRCSVAALTASINSYCSRYYVTSSVQKSDTGLEVRGAIVNLRAMMTECLKGYQLSNNNKLPEAIFFYRKGVPESQFEQVRSFEVKAIREACEQMEIDEQVNTISITFITVQKRHRAEFFPTERYHTFGNVKNMWPGTVVDEIVVHPTYFEFYLCSQGTTQGISRPARYHVLYDDSDVTCSEVYKITYYLCHTVARSSNAVKIPAPVYYAALALQRSIQHLKVYKSINGADSVPEDEDVDIEALQEAITVSRIMKTRMYFQ